jgi:uncharacterized OsmC-like protein
MNRVSDFKPATPKTLRTVFEMQEPLRALYSVTPEKAWIVDTAMTNSAQQHPPDDAFLTQVSLDSSDSYTAPIAVHPAVGGTSELPTPGHMLAAAIASCFDSAIRMIAGRLDVKLQHLEVRVDLGVDVRGTLCMSREVAVGFQSAEIKVDIKGVSGTPKALLDKIVDAAEHSCILLQTLRNPPPIVLETTTR